MSMQCKCGKTIHNVPDRLRDLAEWVCWECGNAHKSDRGDTNTILSAVISSRARRLG